MDYFEREALIVLYGSISECEPAINGWSDRLVGVDLAFPGTGAAVLKTGGTDRASEAGLSK